jgi:ribosomal protein S18 acetylase RimI-like enzyme
MIQVESRKLSSEECKTLAEITISARRGTPLEGTKSAEEIATNIEHLSATDGFQFWIASDVKGRIIGWTYDYVGFPLMTFISGFLPHIAKTKESEKIALSLIEAEKKSTVERGHSRLEIELVFPSDEYRKYSEQFIDLYKKCGFQYATEEVHMTSDLTEVDLPILEMPPGYTLKRFSDVPYELLEGPGFEALEDSKEALFLSMNRPEKMVTLKYFFDKSKPFIEEASIILEREGEIAGFIVTRKGDNEIEIGPVGLIPKARGQGLGTYMLCSILKGLKDVGINRVSLDTSVTNDPARKLYKKFGFEDIYHKQFYYWSP